MSAMSFGVSPIDIHMTSAHFTVIDRRCRTIDGQGLLLRHRSAHIEDLVQAGCGFWARQVAADPWRRGSGHRFIPDAIELKTGLRSLSHWHAS